MRDNAQSWPPVQSPTLPGTAPGSSMVQLDLSELDPDRKTPLRSQLMQLSDTVLKALADMIGEIIDNRPRTSNPRPGVVIREATDD